MCSVILTLNLSLERIQAYLDIEHEPKATEAGKPPASWPTTGDLRVESLSSRYSEASNLSSLTQMFCLTENNRLAQKCSMTYLSTSKVVKELE